MVDIVDVEDVLETSVNRNVEVEQSGMTEDNGRLEGFEQVAEFKEATSIIEETENDHLSRSSSVESVNLNTNSRPESQELSYSERQQYVDGLDSLKESSISVIENLPSYESITRTLDEVGEPTLYHRARALHRYETHHDDVILPVATIEVDPYNYLYGTTGVDVLAFTAGMDKAFLGAGDDIVAFSAGADVIYGGTGDDTYDLTGQVANFTVDLWAGTSTSATSATVRIYEFENVIGGDGNDIVRGDNNANIINGGDGNDRIIGTGGNDTLDGGNGSNVLDYTQQTTNLLVNLSVGAASGAGIGSDIISNFNEVRLGSGDDFVTGSAAVDTFYGGDGDDTINGGGGDDRFYAGAGDDNYNGSSGSDYILFTNITADVTINLDTDVSFSTQTGTDSVVSIEHVMGGAGNDNIVGCGCSNFFSGGAGDDVIDGAGGVDIILGGAGADTLTGGSGADQFVFLASDGLEDMDTITDFSIGAGDFISIADVLDYNSGTDDINDYVSFVDVGADLRIDIDADGAASSESFTQFIYIIGGAGLDRDTMIASVDLVV